MKKFLMLITVFVLFPLVVLAKENTYTVTFDANDGVGTMAKQEIEPNKSTALNENTYRKLDSIFKEWNTKTDGSGTSYADGASITLTGDITLYAQWKSYAYTYDEAQKIIKEVMKAYYLKGERIQYNYARTFYGKESPEDATSQNILYTVCAAYTTNVYSEAFGMIYDSTYKYPRYNSEIRIVARNYYKGDREENPLDGHYLIYYQNTKEISSLEPSKYVYNSTGEISVSDFAQLIEPGDLFSYGEGSDGHALIAYDKVKKADGTWDVLILNSGQAPFIPTRIHGTNKISYNMYKSSLGNNGVLDIPGEGSVKYTWLSRQSSFVKDEKINCQKLECAVVRPFYNNAGLAKFNFPIYESKYNKSKLRLDYPGLDIDKVVSVGDNNSVYPGDELTYTINITNRSDITSDEYDKDVSNVTYGEFYIEETLDSNVNYVSNSCKCSSSSCSSCTLSGDKLLFTVNKALEPSESISLTYKVSVKNNIGNTITSSGKFYKDSSSSIRLANINNRILQKVNLEEKTELNGYEGSNLYQKCYNKITSEKSYSGLKLIDEIYKCATDYSFNFDTFEFEKVFNKKENIGRAHENIISIKEDLPENNTSGCGKNKTYICQEDKKYVDMILNNYWSGLFYNKEGSNYEGPGYYQDLPKWSGSSAVLRAETINYVDYNSFKDGDVLIYYIDYSKTDSTLIRTKETGMYAYIYINGVFIGKNYTDLETERNSFTYDYYGTDSEIKSKLYAGNNKLTESNKDKILTFANYQTLFDKDYYVILRPETVMTKVIFNKNGGSGSMPNQKLIYNVSTALTQNKFTKEGYTFKGWNTKANGTGESYIDKAQITLTSDITLYAIWEEVNTIILDPEDYVYDSTNNYIDLISQNTKLSDYIAKLNIGSEYTYSTTLKSTDIIYTGSKIKILKNSTQVLELTNIVRGDINGDGLIKSGDYIKVKKHIMETDKITDAVLKKAADVNTDNKVTSQDYIRIKKLVMGI